MDLVGDDKGLFAAVLALGRRCDGLDGATIGQIDAGEANVEARIGVVHEALGEHVDDAVVGIARLALFGGEGI